MLNLNSSYQNHLAMVYHNKYLQYWRLQNVNSLDNPSHKVLPTLHNQLPYLSQSLTTIHQIRMILEGNLRNNHVTIFCSLVEYIELVRLMPQCLRTFLHHLPKHTHCLNCLSAPLTSLVHLGIRRC